MKSFHKCMNLACHISEINRRTNNKCISSKYSINDRGKIVFPEAMASLSALALAGEAAPAAVKIQIVQIDVLGACSDRFSTFLSRLEKAGGIPVFSRTGIQNDRVHSDLPPIVTDRNGGLHQASVPAAGRRAAMDGNALASVRRASPRPVPGRPDREDRGKFTRCARAGRPGERTC